MLNGKIFKQDISKEENLNMAEKLSGTDVQQIMKQGLYSIRERSQSLLSLGEIQRVIFCGSSCVGKSTLEDAVRKAALTGALAGKINVPSRVITRPPRPDDRKDFQFCTTLEFEALVAEGKLGLYGVKIMEGGRQEPYGFTKPEEGTIPIYFANNQTFKNKISVGPAGVLDNALIVLIYAPDNIREERLRQRSPELFVERPEEVAFRLSAQERAIKLVSEAHLIIKNFGLSAGRAVEDMIKLLEGVSCK